MHPTLKTTLTLLAATIPLLFLPSCSTPNAPLATAPNFDATQYAGVWHEIARLPNRFERDVIAARATYGKLENGKLSVLNEGQKSTGKETTISGTATPAGEAKYKIRFNKFPANLFAGNYWILWVDPAHQKALVGTPSRKFLWLLAKDPTATQADFPEALQLARQAGFSTTLIENPKRISKKSPPRTDT